MSRNNWTRDELIVALYWYCTKISFSKIKFTKPEVIELSKLVGRTPSAAAFKLVNFARLDPTLQARGVKGMSRGSKAEEPVWNEYYNNWDNLAYTAEKIIAERKGISIDRVSNIEIADLPKSGREREAIVKVRINQSFFRNSVLVSYNNRCCVTGISIQELLVASHIIPWSVDPYNRINPSNGLCLNALHDKAFDKGLITITSEYKLLLSKELIDSIEKRVASRFFTPYSGKKISVPQRFIPQKEFLEYHNRQIFKP